MSDQDEDFAALFAASERNARQFDRGQLVEGTVVAIGPKVAFVSVGGKGEAEIDVAELKDDTGALEVAVGDRLQARVVSTSGGLLLSRKGVRSAATQRELEDAYESGLAVEGRVERAVKGGYEVRIARERGFCPMSQIDVVRTVDPAVHEGKVYAFRIIEFKNGGKDLVVSRRAQLESEQRAQADEVRKKIVAGAILPGRVTSVLEFGAFVDLGGGIQGLLHVSEMAWSRVATAGAIVAPGDEITVKVLRADEATGKISLGLKQLQNDPWATVADRLRGWPGAHRTGDPGRRVRRVRRAGARHRGAGARLHVPAHRAGRGLGQGGAGGHHRRLRDPDHRPGAEAHRGRDGRSGHRPRGRRGRGTGARSSPGRSSPARSSGTRSSASSSSSRRARPA